MTDDVSRLLAGLSVAERTALELRLLRRQVQPGTTGISRRAGSGPAPLSFAQQRLWFLEQLYPGTPLHNMSRLIRLNGRLDLAVLQRSLDAIVDRHAALRTTIVATNGIPAQTVAPPSGASMAVTDLSGMTAVARETEARRLVAEEARLPFDLVRGPLFRAVLLRLGTEEHLLVLNMHHIISDGWSREVLARELTAFYQAFCTGAPAGLPELPIQYADYAVWQREWLQGERLERELRYWREQLRGAPAALDLPTDYPRPPVRSGRGARERLLLPARLCEELRALSQREGVTLFATVLAAFQTLLARYTGQDDILVGSPIAGRTRAETEALIGFFVNTVVLRTDLSGNPTFRELLRRVREVTLGAYDHPDIPFEQLVEELQPERDMSRSPIFQVLFALQNVPQHRLELPGLTLHIEAPESGTAKFDLTLAIFEVGAGLRAEAEYSSDLFAAGTITRMLGNFRTLLEGIVADPDQRISALPLLTEPERRQLLVEWNATATDYPREATLGQLFDAQVGLRPDATAVVFQHERLTYRELDARANRLARYLRARGAGREQRVGVCLERSADLVIGLLAIVKAGAAYVPLDPSYPPERLRFMLDDAQVGVLLSDSRQSERMPSGIAPAIVRLDTEREAIDRESSEPVPSDVLAGDLAYVMYTSGSTGRPKGVAIPHRGIIRLVCHTDFVQLTPADRVAQVSTVMFDVATWEIWGAVLNGATLVVIPREVVLSPQDFAAALREGAITSIDVTTALFNQLAREVPDVFRTVREVQLGGEAADPGRLREILAQGPPERLINSYGPTECTVIATSHEIREVSADAVTVPIGRPIANTPVYVLDRHLELVPVGVPGELYLGGPGLARGYFNRPGLTAERFVPNPFAPTLGGEAGGRLYRTGDRVRWRGDGALEFFGRLDDQIKLRGHRIEPGEIESALREHPGVRAVIVLAREDAPGRRKLVAYIVPEGTAPASDEWRRFLQQRLPDFMVPSVFVALETLPLAPSGKVDRRALPAPKDERPRLEQAFVPPRDSTEESVAAIWVVVLTIDRVGIHDDFFALGGHSLLATQVISRIRSTFDVELPLHAVFEAPTVAALAARIAAAPRVRAPQQPPADRGELERRLLKRRLELGDPAITPRGDAGPAPLSFAQQRLWFLEQLYPGTPLHNMSRLMRLHGKLDVAALRRTLEAVVARHEALRTSIVTVADTPVQVVAPDATLPVAIADLGGLAEAERQTEADRLVSEATRRPFDLARGPLFRALLLRLGAEEHLLLLTMHHIISDAWSIGVLSRELTAFYQAFTTGAPHRLPELPIQYADYAVWQREWLQGERLARELAYWMEQLRGAPAVLELPTDRPRPAVQSSRGSRESLLLPAEVSQGLQALSRREGVTLFATLLAAFQVLLARYTGQLDVVVGAPIAGRTHTETEGLIGFFVNTLAMRTDLSGDPTFRELLQRVREVTLEAYAHQHIPFEQLVEELQPERDMSRTPVFQVALAMQNVPRHPLELPGLTLRSEATDSGTAKFDLTLFLAEQGSGLRAVLEYCTDLFDAGTAVRLLGHFRTLLEGILADPDRRLSELPLLTQPERHQLLVEWNATTTDYPRDATVGDLFRIQAARTPDAVAVVGDGERLTYRELEMRADRLAHYLCARGGGLETRVGVCLERSVDLVVGVLAILLAGGAYVPLDPGDPPDRLRFLLRDARADILLSESRHRGRVPPGSVATTIYLDDERDSIAREPAGSPSRGRAGNLACVMYTSGSTGSPKGVAVPHQAVARLVLATDYFRGGPEEVFLQLAPMAFDLSTFEIWGALLTGARLVIAPPGTLGLEEIGRVVREQGVTTLWLTAGLFHQMVDRGLDDLRGIRQLLAGGDVLSVAHVERVRRELPHCRMINGYGPTEGTTFASCHPVTGGELLGSVPIGRPIANTRTYVLDGRLEPVPVGLPGELYLGGAGLARGYLGRPGLTADRFIPDPFGPELGGELGGRLYRTGDRARWRADGLLEFLGRSDDQVKLRGHRVEPGEVEVALREHPAVRAAVVTAREDIPGEKRLVAYLVPAGPVPGVSELRDFLHHRLPDFMVPSAFVTLAELPLSRNGKVDRKALPAPAEAAAGPEEAFVPPRNAVEELLATIWATVLRIERVGVHDNFFELGGHSLLATQVISRILAALGVELPLRTIFEAPTVAALALRVAAAQTSVVPVETPDLVPVAREAYRATSAQRRHP